MSPPKNLSEIKILSALKKGEKSLWDISRATKTLYATLRQAMMQLLEDGVVERRWDDSGKTNKSRKHLYRIRRG